jgi:NADPH2:quinone reductase
MKAVRIHAFGGPEVLTYEDIAKPLPKEHEVLFKVTSTCVNYADVQWRLGNYVDRSLPATLGREAAGIIKAVGPGVTTLQVGQPIMARAIGGNAEYAIAKYRMSFAVLQGWRWRRLEGFPSSFSPPIISSGR